MSEPIDVTCAATQRCSHQPAPGLLVCRGHLERLSAMLRDIEDEAIRMSAVPSLAAPTGGGGGSLASERAPARLDVLVHNDPRSRPAGQRLPGPHCSTCWHDSCTDIRTWLDAYDVRATETLSVLDVLHSLARMVREERDLTVPWAITVTGERDLLSRQLEWLAAQPWIDEAYADLDRLLKQLRARNGTGEPRRKAVGLCPTLMDDGECAGRLWPNDEDGSVVCDRCARNFGPKELRHLGDMLLLQGYVEIFRAHWYTGVPTGTIRRWVSEGRCTSQKDGKKLMVMVSEVQKLQDRGRRRGMAS